MTTKFATSAVLLLGLAAASWSQAGNVRSVTTGKLDGGGYRVTVTGDGLTQPKTITALQGKVYIAEFAANLRTDKGSVKVGSHGIDSVQYGWFSARPPKVRIVLRLNDASITPTVTSTSSGWTITVGDSKSESTSVKAAVTAVKTESQAKVDTPLTSNGAIVPPTLPYPAESHPIPRAGSKALLPGAKTAPVDGGQESSATDIVRETRRAATLTDSTQATGKRVSLDFVATDIIQILKALSIQSSVNIVSAPDVSPSDKPVKLTVSLANVSLDEALSYVTAISSLRFAKVGNTYIVTPRDSFSSAMNSVMERLGKQSETRVVNLISGEAVKIKEATMRAMPQDGRGGYYEIIVPDKHDIPGVVTSADSGSEATGDGKSTATPKVDPPKGSGRVFYLMVVGDRDRVSQIDTYIRELDQKIAETSNLNSQENKGTAVVPIQSGETGRIKQMIDRLVGEHPRAAEFSVQESILEGATKGEAQTMALLMFGPKDEIGRLEQWARAMDKDICGIIGKPFEADNAGLDKIWEVVELDFIEPTIMELDLKTRFKGLQVSLMPEGVSPGIKGKTSVSEQNTGATGAGQGGDGAAADGGQEQKTGTTNEERTITGREPMTIVLRGTQAMITEAKNYIAMVDVSPKQVALELRVMEMTKEDALRVGIDWSALTGGRLRSWRFNQGLGDTSASPGTLTGGTQKTDAQGNPTGSSDTFDFLATLDKIDNGRNLIARPNSLVSDGRNTNLFVGDTVRYIKSIQSTQNGTTVETDEINVGVTFNAGVRIGGNGNIALALNQNFSILTGFTPVPGGGNLPQTSDRTTDMFVNMQSGETLAIGGLILDQDRKRVSGIPILKDLPIIGYLFSRTDNSKVRTEIVFFLTAKVVDASNRKNAASPATSERKTPKPLEDYQSSKGGKPKGEKGKLF